MSKQEDFNPLQNGGVVRSPELVFILDVVNTTMKNSEANAQRRSVGKGLTLADRAGMSLPTTQKPR